MVLVVKNRKEGFVMEEVVQVFIDENVAKGDKITLLGRLAMALTSRKAVRLVVERNADLFVSYKKGDSRFIVVRKNNGIEKEFHAPASFMGIKESGDGGFWDSILT